MRSVEAVVEARTPAGVTAAFDHIVPIDLSTIFRGYGPLPAVVGTTDQSGPWDSAGQTRTVQLGDGSTARERLLIVERPGFFSYRVADFSGVLRHLTLGAHGQWWFTEDGDGTAIRWSYAFESKSTVSYPALFAISRLWQRYMRRALDACCASIPS